MKVVIDENKIAATTTIAVAIKDRVGAILVRVVGMDGVSAIGWSVRL